MKFDELPVARYCCLKSNSLPRLKISSIRSISPALNFDILSYKKETSYKEVDQEDTIPYFNSLESFNYLKTTGDGINCKIGFGARLESVIATKISEPDATVFVP